YSVWISNPLGQATSDPFPVAPPLTNGTVSTATNNFPLYTPVLARGTEGEIYFSGVGPVDEHTSPFVGRLNAQGTVAWSVNLGNLSGASTLLDEIPLVAAPGGGICALGRFWGEPPLRVVIKITPAGEPLW